MNKFVFAAIALFATSSAASAEVCWTAKQNWQDGNHKTCADIGRYQGVSRDGSKQDDEPPPSAPVVVTVTETLI
ncbi:MAG: hypothetical protein GYA66_06465 [Phyllobacteriaceae bacterium]|jgi:hypothetical protein|nr:hypothetical protein [Phyllobacteriaceae bacterium]